MLQPTSMMAFNIYLAFPLLPRKQVLADVSLNVLFWTSLIFAGISLVVKEPHRRCEDVQVLQGVPGTRVVTGKTSSRPLSLFACRGKTTYYEITLAIDSTLSKWLESSPSSRNTPEGMSLMDKKSKEFHLTVVAHGEACEIPAAKADVRLHSQDRICVHAKNLICSGGWYAKHVSITFAEIVLQTDNTPEIKDQLNLICTMAEYLHLDPSSLTLIPVEDSLHKYFRNLTVLAEGIRYINATQSHHVGLCWPVGFGVFAMLSELVRVLSHNVESDNLSRLLGYQVVGWRVLKQGHENRNPNKWQKRKMATPKPTWRPTQTQDVAVLMAAVPDSVVKSEESPLLVNKTTFSVIRPYIDLSTRPVMVNRDLETPQVSQSTMFHYLSSELSPSLMLSSTEFEGKGTFETPPISDHVLCEASLDTSTQEDFPTAQKSEPKDNSTFHYFSLFMSVSKNHFPNSVPDPRDILPEEMSSTPSSPELFSGELRNLNDCSLFMHRTASGFKSGEIMSIIELSLPSIATLAYLRTSSSSPSELSFSSVAISLLFLHDSYQNSKLLNVYSSVSETFLTLAPMKEIEVSEWIQSSISTDIPSIFGAIVTNGDVDPRPGSLSNASPSAKLYYCSNDPTSSKHCTDTLNNSTLFSSKTPLTFSLLSKTISNPVLFPSFSLSVPVEVTFLFGSSNISPMEKLPQRRQVSSDGINAGESFTAIPLTYKFVMTGNSVLVVTKTETDTSLWIKEATGFFITTFSAVTLSSGLLSEGERSHRKSQVLEVLSYGSSWITPPLQLANTTSLYFSTNQWESIHNLVRTPVLEPDALQLDIKDFNLESSFGTKMNVQITRDVVSKLNEAAIVFSRKGISTENGLHATTTYQKTQGQPNTPPRVIHAIKWIAATVGHELSFSIPPETFHDQEDGNSTQLTLGMNPVNSPTGLESWLQFNAEDQRMYGYPLDADFQYSPQEFLLFAIDSGGLKTEDKFLVEIFKPTIIPCHVYTVIATNSYHSFLKNRRRIHFFLKKLSDYLLAESPGDVVLLHLKTGSAVFMWYNKSFCPKTEKCARDDIEDVLTKLGRCGKDVHPDFAEAMLPEFEIEQIGEVVYAGICSSATKPTNESVVFNKTVTGFKDGNCWITHTLLALLIAVCSTTLVFLIVVHCQKYRKKTFEPQCSPSGGHIDFKMDTPTSRKSPLLEQDVLPSTRLPMSVVSQQRSFRPHPGLVIPKLPSPPKYRLPPLYGRRDPG